VNNGQVTYQGEDGSYKDDITLDPSDEIYEKNKNRKKVF